ncbi:porin family protein [Shewanella woodyi]|uniref:OmpA domain protein transmembrane region-containing protein n=1 Tax=Shewanella woodyi (strain ATCC 51908 / MS32) TaxID=392500 RepID=B1KPP0_SHEWM|nr:outer membrane beta-barrel protein [Shewanella woodyi]ACA86193.1 OmpA domain protein transmembrane region-containing protein [Shewanella woodyi ATCC 51908]
MKTLTIAAASLLAIFASSNVAAANDHSGFYVGGSLGQLKVKTEDSDNGLGFGAYGGYNFNDWFGLEANMYLSGDLGGNGYDLGAGTFAFTPKFTYQINDTFAVYGKVGIASMAVVYRPDRGIDEDFTGFGWVYGVGVNASITENLNIRLGYDIVKGDLDSEYSFSEQNVDTDISNFALGMHYQF